jgi:hypothetical protein
MISLFYLFVDSSEMTNAALSNISNLGLIDGASCLLLSIVVTQQIVVEITP